MNRSTWTRLGIIELVALGVLWRSVNAAPLVEFEEDLAECHLGKRDLDETDDRDDRSTRWFRRSVDRIREQRRAG